MKKLFIFLLFTPILSVSEEGGKLTKYVSANYYIDIKLGNKWIQIQEVKDTLEIYWHDHSIFDFKTTENKKVDIIFPNGSDYQLGKLQNCITLNSCFNASTFFQSNDDPLKYSNKDINQKVSLTKDSGGNIISISLEISNEHRIRHIVSSYEKLSTELDKRNELTITKKEFFIQYLKNCKQNTIKSLIEIVPDLPQDYCDCIMDKILEKFDEIEFNNNYISMFNKIDWNGNESILWINSCSGNKIYKKEAKKIRK